MKLFNDPHNLTAITVEALPDPAKLDDKTLKALNGLFAELDYNAAIYEDEVLVARVEEWRDDIAIESGRRPWASPEDRRIAEVLTTHRYRRRLG